MAIKDVTPQKNTLFGVEVSTQKQQDYSNYERFTINNIEAGVTFTGKPQVVRFEPKEDRKSTTVRIRLVDDEAMQLLDAYMNVPLSYPLIKGINKSFEFYRSTFDCLYSLLALMDKTIVLDSEGNPINRINKIDLEQVITFLNNKKSITIKIIKSNPDSEYNSFCITHIQK